MKLHTHASRHGEVRLWDIEFTQPQPSWPDDATASCTQAHARFRRTQPTYRRCASASHRWRRDHSDAAARFVCLSRLAFCCARRSWSFSCRRCFLTSGPHKWQKLQAKPFSQPLVCRKAQGLQLPAAWSREPMLGNLSVPNAGPGGGGGGAEGAHRFNAKPSKRVPGIWLTTGLRVSKPRSSILCNSGSGSRLKPGSWAGTTADPSASTKLSTGRGARRSSWAGNGARLDGARTCKAASAPLHCNSGGTNAWLGTVKLGSSSHDGW
mmetsp:Transcript_109522/g.275502  ORF Transcript_109522/g.275502 Transcript_109522/m.275502 type:complete len:266 (-) Transcript_109522:139-936(-)